MSRLSAFALLAALSLMTAVSLEDDKQDIPVRTLDAHKGSVLAVSFSPDGKTLASGSRDKTIKLWDVKSGELKQKRTDHKADVYSVVFSPKGDMLASGSGDKTIRLWDAKT